MGMFDDLVPVPDAKPKGLFDDLVQQGKNAQAGQGVTFHDLVPPAAVQLPPRPGVISEYLTATKQTFGELGEDYTKGRGDKSAFELWKTESLPANAYHGVQRLRGKETPPHEDRTDHGIVSDLKAIGVTAEKHPGILAGSFVRSLIADPELLLPWLWEAIPEATAARVAQAARAMGASVDAAKAAEVAGRVGGRMLIGGTVGATVEAGQQFKTGEYDAGKIGKSAAESAVMSVPGRMKGKPAAVAPEVAAATEHVAATVDSTAESVAHATAEDPITPEAVAEISKEKPVPAGESTKRLVTALKQATVGGAVGAGIGYAVSGKDNVKTSVETGAALGVVLPLLKARAYRGVDIAPLVNARNGQVRAVARHVYQFQKQIETLVPDKAMRERIAEHIDTGTEPAAGMPEHEAYTALKGFFAQLGQLAKDAGVIPELRDNYISHIVEGDIGIKQTLWQRLTGSGAEQSAGAKRFGMERKYDTFEELQAAIKDSGLKLKTKDPSEIAGIYANAVYRSIANKRLLDAVKSAKLPDGSEIVMAADKAPSNWVRMGNPSLAGVAVHPDIAADLNFVFSHREPNAVRKALEALTSSIKRLSVSASLFHAKTLTEGYLLAGGVRKTATLKSSIDAAMKMYREGGNNDVIDHLIKNGLIIGTPEDVAGHEVQHVLGRLGDKLNEMLPLKGLGLGAIAKAGAAIDKGVERFTFGYLQTGMKLSVSMSEYERLVKQGIPKDRAARSAASYTNDVFGSLDWYRVATDTESHIMRRLGAGTLNTNGRKVLQLLLFAPDWTAATFRSLAKAMPGGSDAVTAQLHRRYALKAAIYYLTVANAINGALSGHDLWKNKDMTRIELGNGQTMQFAKHETEPLEWLRHPLETGLSKAAFLPASVIRLKDIHDRNKAYRKPIPTPIEDLEAIAPELVPISLQQWVQNGLDEETVSSMLGFPIYGKKPHVQEK